MDDCGYPPDIEAFLLKTSRDSDEDGDMRIWCDDPDHAHSGISIGFVWRWCAMSTLQREHMVERLSALHAAVVEGRVKTILDADPNKGYLSRALQESQGIRTTA
jgi:hypothetical protein